MKKVLFVINTMGRAGAETALLEMLRRMLETGEYELSLFAIIPRGELFSRVPEGVHILNPHVSNDSVLSTSGRMAIARQALLCACKHLYGIRHLGDIVRNIRQQRQLTGRVQLDKVLWRVLSDGAALPEEEYDLAIAYLEGAATYYVSERVHAKAKAAFVHIDYQQAGYTPLMDKGCYDRIDRIFMVSNNVRDRFCQVYPQYRDKAFLFRNLLNRKAIEEKSLAQGFTDGFTGTRLVTVGRLHYQKAYDIAIDACARLVERGYNIRWYVLGEGAERPALEKQIAVTGMQEHFCLMGAVDNPYPYLRQADIYVHASRYEGKSIAIEEAQILGKPIVASNCTGNREQIVHEVDGLLLDLSTENLVDTLCRVLDDTDLRARLAQNVRTKALEHPEDMANLLALVHPDAERSTTP